MNATIPTPPIIVHYNHLLSSSSSLSHLKQIHAKIIRSGLHCSNSLLIKLVLSVSTLSFDYALSVFDQMHNPQPHLSNKFLRELSRSNRPENTLLAYANMRDQQFLIDNFSFPSLLKACTKLSALSQGMKLHGFALKLDFLSDPFVQTGLVAMYAACSRIEDARMVFDNMSDRDIVMWKIMISGYCESDHYNNVLPLMEEMKRSNVKPDDKIYSIIPFCLRACWKSRI